MNSSKLLDLSERNEQYQKINKEMLTIALLKNPIWFRFFLKKSNFLQRYCGYNHWSRAWEYPWAIENARLSGQCRIIDVGGGGTSFADYLAQQGHECYVIDPSLRDGIKLSYDVKKTVFKNIRSYVYQKIIQKFNINTMEGIRIKKGNTQVKYFAQSAADIQFPDAYFDTVFCISVMEHIPHDLWQKCMGEFVRVIKPKGRILLTLDMTLKEADSRLYQKLVDYCPLELIGNPHYTVPISEEDRKRRHGHLYETIGLVWQA